MILLLLEVSSVLFLLFTGMMRNIRSLYTSIHRFINVKSGKNTTFGKQLSSKILMNKWLFLANKKDKLKQKPSSDKKI